MRTFKVLYRRFCELSLNQFFALVYESLFFNNKVMVYGYNLKKYSDNKNKIANKFIVKKGEVAEIKNMDQKISPLPWEFQCHLFDEVNDFFVAKDANGVQHISWIYYHNNRNRILRLGTKEAEVKFCFTLPGARGKGIYPQVLRDMLFFLREKGMRWAFICVYPDNYPSIRGIEKAGFMKIGEVRLKKVFGIQISTRFEPSKKNRSCN